VQNYNLFSNPPNFSTTFLSQFYSPQHTSLIINTLAQQKFTTRNHAITLPTPPLARQTQNITENGYGMR
jgi:hypothetical protein